MRLRIILCLFFTLLFTHIVLAQAAIGKGVLETLDQNGEVEVIVYLKEESVASQPNEIAKSRERLKIQESVLSKINPKQIKKEMAHCEPITFSK